MQVISYDEVYELIESKRRELCLVGQYGRSGVYGTDREKYDAWEEILENIASMDKHELPPEEELIVDDVATNHKIKICSFEDACKLRPNMAYKIGLMMYGITKDWDGWDAWKDADYFNVSAAYYSCHDGYSIPVEFVVDITGDIPNIYSADL